MLPVATLAAGLAGMAGAVVLIGGVSAIDGGLNKGAAGLPEVGAEAGWESILGAGGLGVALALVGTIPCVATVGEALLGGDRVEPAAGVAAGGFAAEGLAEGGLIVGGVAAGMGVAVGDCVGTGGE